ncbi:MAG: TIGR01440 family protein [Fibrobacter sp.]|nr:TIGR01440 family protein [Fibrobacter sp.]
MSGIQTYEVKDENLVEQIRNDAKEAAKELVEVAKLHSKSIVVIGCSTSETLGEQVGSHSVPEVGKAILAGLQSVFDPLGIYIAAQCCEHLNRAIIIEREAVPHAEIVNVVPQPKAGGSFATACYAAFKEPVALEHIKADAGIDIGGTLIGMHLKEVAVPLRLKQRHIGKAFLVAARTRPKFIGGERAHYDESLKSGYPV